MILQSDGVPRPTPLSSSWPWPPSEDLFIWEPTRPVSNEPLPVFASPFAITGDLRFVGGEHLVAFDDSSILLLRLGEQQYEQVRLTALDSRPIAVLPTRDRHQFAVLEASGRLTLHRTDDDE